MVIDNALCENVTKKDSLSHMSILSYTHTLYLLNVPIVRAIVFAIMISYQ